MNLNPAHWHLIVNHLPITGSLIAVLILLYGILRKNEGVIKAAYWLFALMAVFSVVATQTGEGAERFILDAKLADEAIIERHVEASNIAQWVMVIVGITALAALFINRLKTVRAMPVIVFILALIAAGLMAWAGLLGGEIMHQEIRSNNNVVLPR
ncbi:MAG: hypothetical protein B7X86_06690 [Sphingobacteriales bacterium 17-39-43]|nr:MAG: hypothetical protein B7Y24_07505 [Sphingobacteriales bacterium 16-39-50]OZA25076.1 MAG: hypothetical protein B7X86_06690 [Sphingobacteriales bacterium 17-39-43]